MWLNFKLRGGKKSRASDKNRESYRGLSDILSRLTSVNFFIHYSSSCQLCLKGLSIARNSASSTQATFGGVLATFFLTISIFLLELSVLRTAEVNRS